MLYRTFFRNIFTTTRPSELVREFIQDCLYHNTDGYFNNHQHILYPIEAIQFKQLKNERHYWNHIQQLYGKSLSHWHTSSMLFRPWYGYALAKYIMKSFNDRNIDSFINIYEIGPGLGTLCLDILDYFSNHFPLHYGKIQYHMIETSKLLHEHQKQITSSSKHSSKISCYNQSIIDDNLSISNESPCFILALELLDNLPQDKIKFESNSMTPLQGLVLTNENARYSMSELVYVEEFEPVSDYWINHTLFLMNELNYHHPSTNSYSLDKFYYYLLSRINSELQNPYESEFIPTMIVKFLYNMKNHFPDHQLIISDFDYLPDAIPGHCSPVVQTYISNATIACSNYLLKRGLFDIFFPISFHLLSDLYSLIMNSNSSTIMTQNHFMKQYADLGSTTTKSGFNPLLEEFKNVSMMIGSTYSKRMP